MINKKKLIGYLLATLAALLGAIYYVPYKALISITSPQVFIFAILSISTVINFLVIPFSGFLNNSSVNFNKTTIFAALLAAVFTITGNFAVGKSLITLSSSVTSVIIKIEILFVLFAGWFYFKEQISKYFIIGTVVSVIGIVVISSDQNFLFSYSSHFQGVLWALLGAISFSMIHIITKAVYLKINPVAYNFIRNLAASIFMLIILDSLSDIKIFTLQQWLMIFAAALCGPFLSRLLQTVSLNYIPVSHVIVFGNLLPVFTLFIAWLFINDVPSLKELTGSFIIIMGLFVSVIYKVLKYKKH